MPSAKPIAAVLLLAVAAATALPACGPSAASKTPEPVKESKLKAPNQPKPPDKDDVTGEMPHALSWVANKPAQISVFLKDGPSPSSEPTFTYEPNPPDVTMSLAAGPGTPSFQLKAVELTWIFQPTGEEEIKVGPQKLPITPVNVVGAPSDSTGQPFTVYIPLDVMTAKDYFMSTDPKQRVSSATVLVSFYDAKDKPVFGVQTLIPLRVPIRITLK